MKSTPTCSRCQINPPRPGQRYCHECHAAYARANRPKYCEFTPEQQRRADARTVANMAVRRGQIPRRPCEIPGCKAPADKHHPDYSRPLEVQWLCQAHHLAEHGRRCHRVVPRRATWAVDPRTG